MVSSILKYIEPQLKAYMQFLNRVDSPVFRISNGEMIKGNGQEKEVVTISDLNGNSLYIRQTQPETINERKALSSCDKEYNISARCKVVFYSFGGNDFTINPDKVKSKIINTLARLDFSHYTGSSTEIKIDINGNSLDMEKIYTEETGKEFSGNVWPTLVSVDFTLSYVDTNCNTCDIDDNETVVTWMPDLTPESCETKAICEVISKCDVIIQLQEETASLQEQIDNLPTTSGVQSVSGTVVDNTDPLNPVVKIPTLQEVTDEESTTTHNISSNGGFTALDVSSNAVGDMNDSGLYIYDSTLGNVLLEADRLNDVVKVLGNEVEVKSNKATNFNTLNNNLFPTTQATKDLVDYYIQSNIKIIGDWDATSGNYPKNDESNTTPFIAQWGATIKAGWAFRVGYGQAGTVDGYDYENGDVVYALIDNPSFSSSVDWGDLDHNLQQANESVRGTSKVITAAIASDETTTDDERYVTGKKLWLNFWTRVLAIAHTFTAKITFASAPRFNSVSALEILVVDANKDLTSEAKESAFNKPFGTTAGTITEGGTTLIKAASVLFTHAATNLLASTTYYFGQIAALTASSAVNSIRSGVAPFTGHVVGGTLCVYVGSTLGSSQTATMTIYNKSNGTSQSASINISYDVSFSRYQFELATPLDVTANHLLDIRITTPAFTTNPMSVIHYATLNFIEK